MRRQRHKWIFPWLPPRRGRDTRKEREQRVNFSYHFLCKETRKKQKIIGKNHPTSNSGSLPFLGLYPKTTLTACPGPIMAPGESLNLRCQGPIYGKTFALIRLEDLAKSFYCKRLIKNEAYFFFRALKIHGAGHYLCFYYDGSYRGSLLSDILKIWVTGKRRGCYRTYVRG